MKKSDFPFLAKSDPAITAGEHVADCLRILEQLKTDVPALPLADRERFWKLLRVAVVVHDAGKAHAGFQALLQGMKNTWHRQRHELFSLCFVDGLLLTEEEKALVAFAIAGHHKSLDELSDFVGKNYKSEETNDLWEIYEEDKPEFQEECRKVNTEAVADLLRSYSLEWEEKWMEVAIEERIRTLRHWKVAAEEAVFWERLLLVGALKQCDHLASAAIRTLGTLDLKDFEFLFRYAWYEHQQKASGCVENVILTAPTGSGKTETALLWLRKQLEEKGQGRVFYVLPFTASINAMYERLNRDLGAGKAGMLHGKLAQYLEYRMEEDDNVVGEAEKKQLLEDFKSMVTPLKVVTPFQLLKSLFGLKGFEKGMFEWCGCYLIFDEIHAYDPKVFAQIIVLLKFMLRYMNASVHIMTATLPRFMRQELEQVVGQCMQITASLDLYEKFQRHRVVIKPGKLTDSLEEIQNTLDEGKQVLVVCNTVAIAQQVYSRLKAGRKVLLHGAFNAQDRYRHEKTLREGQVNLLVGTQAIEVSLDIDYDCIYTEPAPLDALIQRFGRVNRKRKKGICDCFVFEERNEKDRFIYTDADVIGRTLAVLKRMEQEKAGIIPEIYWQEAMDEVYPAWSPGAKEEYEQTLTYLEYEVFHHLSPLNYSERREEDFRKQFTGVQVLPVRLKEEYLQFLNTRQFVKAGSLLVNLNEKRFAGLVKSQQITKERFVFETGENDALSDKSIYVIHRKYTGELGLLIEEEETEEGCFL